MKVSLIIPAYNEEKRLPAFLNTVLTYERQHADQIHEVIIVDDGSTDTTSQQVQKRINGSQPVKLLTLSQNRGKGGAIQAGIEAATGDVVVFTDADGATPITELPKMITALQSADVAVGNRWMSGAHVHKSTTLRHFAGWVYKTYMSLFGLGEIDTMCGFKGYKLSIARDLFSNLLEKRWLFDTEVAYKAVRRKYVIKNFPIEWESKPGSKLDSFTLLKSGFQILPLISKIKKHEEKTF
ncbi:MAG: glycosyltransferase family 2 protein [Candidatus Andersenbacteria bacterium]|nr:glycosyltransferase family 2 protein [Candidatus Andersenbacteria bacterium]MBI3250286.1 glycosyltransferase family 2 protein [Candidatus Andersenbacteria bacterium]